MQKLYYLGLIAIIYISAIFQQIQPPIDNGLIRLQTVPTRTSTPLPTATNSPGNGNPNPTNTPNVPTATATETKIPATLGPTPEGGYLATAVSCSNQPTIETSNTTNVRSGPDTDYDLVGQLILLEVRPIIGRAQNAEWWQITLADGTAGWVADAVVTVSGYTDIVPVVSSPAGDGPVWNPTPNPSCTVTPTPLPTETATIPATLTATATPMPTDIAIAQKIAPDTAVPPTEPPTTVPQPTRVTEPTPLPTAVPLEATNSPNSNNNWLFIGAIGLLLVGGIIFAITRKKSDED